MSGDLMYSPMMLTSGTLEFTTWEDSDTVLPDTLVRLEKDGITYRGYLKSVDIKYAKSETVKYKLIVKDITQ